VFARAFRKAPAQRTPTVGAFADALGAAYGLCGRHLDWARAPELELSQSIEARLPELMLVELPADDVDPSAGHELLRDPFASAPPVRQVDIDSLRPAGVPTGNPWVPAIIIGVLALVLGVAIVVVLL
jgi:serine/threonine-protein kinase